MSRCVATLAALAVVALSTLVAGCASPKPAPPKPPTESEVRAGFTAERSAAARAR
jgi:predicted component of type VI protein secretion system